MAERKIIWSHKARIKLYDILKYYADRNKSKSYSAKLHKKIYQKIQLLKNHPFLGIKTDSENIRAVIIENYILFYEIEPEKIIIHTIWDSRQNPENLHVK